MLCHEQVCLRQQRTAASFGPLNRQNRSSLVRGGSKAVQCYPSEYKPHSRAGQKFAAVFETLFVAHPWCDRHSPCGDYHRLPVVPALAEALALAKTPQGRFVPTTTGGMPGRGPSEKVPNAWGMSILPNKPAHRAGRPLKLQFFSAPILRSGELRGSTKFVPASRDLADCRRRLARHA